MLSDKEKKTIAFYDKNALDWDEKHAQGSTFDPDLKRFFELLPTGKVLEVGTGSGSDAQKLIANYGADNYLGIEPAKGFLKIAKSRNPGAQFLNLSLYDLNKLDQIFDGFWACAVLVHIPKRKLSTALKLLKSKIKKGGIGFISIMEGDVDMNESRPGRFFTLWPAGEFEGELEKAGYKILESRRIEREVGSPYLTYHLTKL